MHLAVLIEITPAHYIHFDRISGHYRLSDQVIKMPHATNNVDIKEQLSFLNISPIRCLGALSRLRTP